MPVPFNQKISEHTESQYLELETNYSHKSYRVIYSQGTPHLPTL